MAPSLCACTAFKLASLIETPGAFLLRRPPRSPAAAGVVLVGRALRRFSVVTAWSPPGVSGNGPLLCDSSRQVAPL